MPSLDLFFTDDRGTRWRVYDVAYGPPHCQPFQQRRVPFASPLAAGRWFVSERGERRVYRLGRGDDRTLSGRRLAEQLARAEYPMTGDPRKAVEEASAYPFGHHVR